LNAKATQKAVTRIGTDTIEGFLGEDRALLIAVLRKDPELLEQLRGLMEVVVEFREEVLVTCYTLEDLLPYFAERFGVGGTPTYLIVRNGELLGSLLGKNTSKALIGFIHENLAGPGESRHAGKARSRDAGAQADLQKKMRIVK
jgi:hypothetical protein